MEEKLIKSDKPYSIAKAAYLMGLTCNEVEELIRSKRLGFELSDRGPVITRKHLSDYYLGYQPYEVPSYKPEEKHRKARKKYTKARTWR
jgi:hypothetical protein